VVVGETITVTKRNGEISNVIVTRVLWADAKSALCEVLDVKKAAGVVFEKPVKKAPAKSAPKGPRGKLTPAEEAKLNATIYPARTWNPGEECAVGHEDDDGTASEIAHEVLGEKRYSEVYGGGFDF